MAGDLEIHNASFLFAGDWNSASEPNHVELGGRIPVLEVPFSLGLISVNWNKLNVTDFPEVAVITSLKVTDIKWSISGEVYWQLTLPYDEEIFLWKEFLQKGLEDLRLGEATTIFVDDHKWDVVSTLNQVLKLSKSKGFDSLQQVIYKSIENASRKYFNSDILPNLLDQSYIQVKRWGNDNDLRLGLTVSADRKHFSSPDPYPPYLFIQIPTSDLEYFLNHFARPSVEVQGYELSFVSLEVIGDNELVINIQEENKGWLLNVSVSPEVKDNSIHLKVTHIDATGLNVLTKVIFNLFKGLLIQQIENRPVPVGRIYQQQKQKLEQKFPFVEIMGDDRVVLKNLNFRTNFTEILVYFEQENVVQNAIG